MRHNVLTACAAAWCVMAMGATNGPGTAIDSAAWGRVFNVPVLGEGTTPLWRESVAVIAGRLKLPRESETSYESSYRAYPGPTTRVLGARPYSFAVYGSTAGVTRVSIMFANKGDFEGLSVGGDKNDTAAAKSERRKALREYEYQIRDDARTVEEALTRGFGPALRDIYGASSGAMREDVKRWDVAGHAIMLAAPRGEYMVVRIVPIADADAEGKGQMVPDKMLRDRLAKRVVKRDNGDVIVTDIPMVDQGGKGFCVPATWERYLRYLGIPGDMYMLAMAGKTGVGGGTAVPEMADRMDKYVKRYGRRIQRDKKRMQIRFVKDCIDKGVPIMWPMFVDREFDRQVSVRMERRRTCTDVAQWKGELKRLLSETCPPKGVRENAHVCMIIGYNKTTDELAISDSWGPGYEERWLTEAEADAIGMDELWSITW